MLLILSPSLCQLIRLFFHVKKDGPPHARPTNAPVVPQQKTMMEKKADPFNSTVTSNSKQKTHCYDGIIKNRDWMHTLFRYFFLLNDLVLILSFKRKRKICWSSKRGWGEIATDRPSRRECASQITTSRASVDDLASDKQQHRHEVRTRADRWLMDHDRLIVWPIFWPNVLDRQSEGTPLTLRSSSTETRILNGWKAKTSSAAERSQLVPTPPLTLTRVKWRTFGTPFRFNHRCC